MCTTYEVYAYVGTINISVFLFTERQIKNLTNEDCWNLPLSKIRDDNYTEHYPEVQNPLFSDLSMPFIRQ